MKKIIFGLIATVTLSSLSFGQSKSNETLTEFEIVKSEKVNFDNIIVRSFFKVTDFYTKNADVKISDQIQLLTLKNGFQAIQFNISSDAFNTNTMYALYNQEKEDFMWYFVDNTDNKIDVLSPERELLSSYSNIKDYISVNFVENRSVFGACMDAVENEYTDTFIGWANWHASPLPAITAAAVCQGCARGWWQCPPAYTGKLRN